MLERLSLEHRTLVFYEAPHRILDSISDFADIMGERKAVVIKELTKFYEEVLRGTLPDVLVRLEQSTIAGEYVIVLEGRPETETLNMDDALAEVRELMRKGLGRKDGVDSSDAFSCSMTSHRLPSSSMTTRLWLSLREDVSK